MKNKAFKTLGIGDMVRVGSSYGVVFSTKTYAGPGIKIRYLGGEVREVHPWLQKVIKDITLVAKAGTKQ
jgi:hypothetical protein